MWNDIASMVAVTLFGIVGAFLGYFFTK